MAQATRFNNNTQLVNGNQTGNLAMTDIIPVQPISQGNATEDKKVSFAQIQAIPYGTCSTASGTATKTVALQNFPNGSYTPIIGSKVLVKFTNANTSSTQMKLTVGTVTANCTCRGVAMGSGSVRSGAILEFTYTGNEFDCQFSEPISAIDTSSVSPINSTAVNVALAEYERIRKYTIYFSPILNNDDSVSSFKEWVLSNISSWNDGDLLKLTSSNNRNAYFHLMKQSNTNFNLFYYTYYQQYPIVYRYVDTSWRIVTPTSTSATW